jgi:hypothetical protein
VRPGPHWHSNARVADFTGLLLHYNFLDEHLHKQAAKAVREEHRTEKGTIRYKKVLEVLENDSRLSIKTDTSKELKSVNDLVGTQFVSVSREYMRFVESEEQRSGHYFEESRSERLLGPSSTPRRRWRPWLSRWRPCASRIGACAGSTGVYPSRRCRKKG